MTTLKLLESLILNKRVLLHGAGNKYEELRPYQADGEVAICATIIPEVAIFMALTKTYKGQSMHRRFQIYIDGTKATARFTCKVDNPTLFSNEQTGYVYVLEQKFFKKYSTCEFRSYQPQKFLDCIEVKHTDLPFSLQDLENGYTIDLNPTIAIAQVTS